MLKRIALWGAWLHAQSLRPCQSFSTSFQMEGCTLKCVAFWGAHLHAQTLPPQPCLLTTFQVAACMLKGIASGSFFMGNPDLGIAVHTRLVKGMVPRSFPGVLLDTLLGLVGPVIHMFITGAGAAAAPSI